MAQCIATRPIIDLCLEAERRPIARVAWRWWEQEGVDFTGSREAAEVEETEG